MIGLSTLATSRTIEERVAPGSGASPKVAVPVASGWNCAVIVEGAPISIETEDADSVKSVG